MSALNIWWKSKSPIFRFLASFVALMVGFYAFYYSPLYEQHIMGPLLSIQAKSSNVLLNFMQFKTETIEDSIIGEDFRVSIKNGCDGIEATALYVCAILAFPFCKLEKKTKRTDGWVVTLSILNLFRIAGLYIAGVHWKPAFEFLHLHGGVIIFTLIAILLWFVWLAQIKNTFKPDMKPPLQFILVTVLAYGLLIALLSTTVASGAMCSGFRSVSTGFLKLALPDAYIQSQDAYVQQKKDPNSFHLIYGNDEVIQAEHQYARSQNIKEYKISSHSIQLFFFQLVTVPISFLIALFIATPMPWRKKGSSLSFALLILLVVILIKVYFLILYNLNASATGVYRLSESELEWILRLISMLTLGFSVMLCFVLWLIFGFRKAT